MKNNQQFQPSLCLNIGLCLNAAYLCSGLLESKPNWILFLLGAMEGLALLLMIIGLLQATPGGRRFLKKLKALKGQKGK